MKKSSKKSRIEIWGYSYINNVDKRDEQDRNVEIIQIEPVNSPGDYIVEVIDKKPERFQIKEVDHSRGTDLWYPGDDE